MKTRKRKMKGGRIGILKRVFNFDTYPIIGAGNYGILARSKQNEVLKLLKRTDDCIVLKKEATIQRTVYTLCKQFCPEVNVPKITYYSQDTIPYKQIHYLCGIGMKYIEPPVGYHTQVHTLLGYRGSDIDTEWGMRVAYPVSETNPTRGFFASTNTLEDIWEEEGSSMNIEQLAYIMGKVYRIMLINGILPIDLEWVWSNGHPWIIDFGLCEFGSVDPEQFLQSETSNGLRYDFYIPHKGDRGYEDFLRGFFGH